MQKLTKINVLADSTTIEDNSADSFRVMLNYDNQADKQYVAQDGTIVTGDNLVVSTQGSTTLGDLKNTLVSNQSRREAITQELADLDKSDVDTQALIDAIQPEMDTAIANVLAQPNAVDNRIIKASPPVMEPPQTLK